MKIIHNRSDPPERYRNSYASDVSQQRPPHQQAPQRYWEPHQQQQHYQEPHKQQQRYNERPEKYQEPYQKQEPRAHQEPQQAHPYQLPSDHQVMLCF